ncbi:phage tailspike protein [Escherichia coli]|nr:phage tailspike protein [Escherichia coli]
MTDITANVIVSMPSQLFTMARSFKAVANGKIYIGKIDTDPVNPENQIQVYVENEDGSHVPVSQPIIINAGGYPVYNGQIAKFVTVQGHSMAVYDAYGAQQFYFPNVLKYDPDQLRADLQSDTLNGLVNDHVVFVKQPFDGSITRTQHDLNAEYISVLDFKADNDSDWTDAFNAACNAAKTTINKIARAVYVPPSNERYHISNVVIPAGVKIFSDGKNSAIITVNAENDSAFIVRGEFAAIKGLTFDGLGRETNCKAISIEAPLVTVEECSFSFFGTCIDMPAGKFSAEISLKHNRYAASKYGIFSAGGQINSRSYGETFSDCDSAVVLIENIADGVGSTTEGFQFIDTLSYSCGNSSSNMAAFDIQGGRWLSACNVMIDLSKHIALRVANSKYFKITGGYLSSNASVNSPCLQVIGYSWDFGAVNTVIGDSRSWGIEIAKSGTDYPVNATLIGIQCQNNDLDASQQGDMLINSVPGVRVIGSNFLSKRTSGVAVLDQLSGGSSVIFDSCSFYGGSIVGATGCKLTNRNSPTHPEEQMGIATIPGGGNSVSIPLTINPLQSGKTIAVLATPASGNDVISAGVQGNNIVINRAAAPAGSTRVSFHAFAILP